MPVSLSVLIVNYNGASFIEETIQSCVKNLNLIEGLKFEILILDNCSNDNSVQVLKDIEGRGVDFTLKVWYSKENTGFAKGCNILAKEATNEVLFLLNNDTKVISLDDLGRYLTLNENIASTIATTNILNKDGTPQNNLFSYPTFIKMFLELFMCRHLVKRLLGRWVDFNNENKVVNGNNYFSGCVLFIHSKLFRELGGFDEGFYFYHEECDLFLRAEKQVQLKKIYLK